MTSFHFIFNLVALGIFWIQAALGASWPWLQSLQTQENFKRWTGLSLLFFLVIQNSLFVVRTAPSLQPYRKGFYQFHLQMSVLSVPLLALHALSLGYAYTCVLSLVYGLNIIVGCVSPKQLDIRHKVYNFYWMVTHVGFSIFISVFVFFHIFITFYYN